MIEQYLLVLLAGRWFFFVCKRGINFIVLFAFNSIFKHYCFVTLKQLNYASRSVCIVLGIVLSILSE